MDWTTITDIGDSAAMLPAAALLFAWLAGSGEARRALLWAGLFVSQAVLVAGTKIAFRGWGLGSQTLDFTGLSGHAALACAVLPIAASLLVGPLLGSRASRTLRLAAIAGGFALGIAVGISRLALAQHSLSEVAGGCALGSLTAILFIALAGPPRPARRLPMPVIAGMAVIMIGVLHGTRAPSDRMLTHIALRLSGHSSPYARLYRPGSGFWLVPAASRGLT